VVFLAALICLFIAYLSGSIPVGYLVARAYGVDVTASGSGRIGGTNVLRAAGAVAAGLTVAGDLFKGMIPVFLLKIFFPVIVSQLGTAGLDSATISNFVVALAMPAAVLGHNHSIFLKFKGGVGAGTALGTVGGVHVLTAILAAVFALIALVISRYASILSTTVAISSVVLLTIFAAMGDIPYAYILGGILNMALIVYSLRPNYARLRAGTERKVGQKTENIKRIS
jgi:glycerol-3-phosphate acyltransferase PlsY